MLEEDRAVGDISFSVWKHFVEKYGGIEILTFMVISLTLWIFFRVSAEFTLADWAVDDDIDPGDNIDYLLAYMIFGLLASIILFAKTILIILKAVACSNSVHSKIAQSVLEAPIPRFFDRISVGILLNRFSNDVCEIGQEGG
mmetsp:Transcript_26402/g.23333  ORF Transcript_26402/g.23333 Transcript_26402/m.23333 type:complete len:142 (+) Transcript_26402:151-576(+)